MVIPKYLSAAGISTQGGHGPGYTTESSFLAFPLVYLAGSAFAPAQPESSGILVGPPGLAFVGKGVTIQGVVAVARGYEATWVWQLWDRSSDATIRLQPQGPIEVSADRQRWLELLRSSKLRGSILTDAEREMLGLTHETELEVRFSKDDQQRVAEFFKD